MTEKVILQIPQAPDFLFHKERTGHILNEQGLVPLIEKMEAVEDFGMCTYFKGVPYARKGFPSPEAIYALNQVKKILLESTKLLKNPLTLLGFLTTNKTELCTSFNVVFDKVFGHFKMKEEFMCRSAFNFALFTQSVLQDFGVKHDVAKEFAFNVAQILEYDDSYRYRFQDLVNELKPEKKLSNEIKKLFVLFKERSTTRVPEKLKHLFTLASVFSVFINKKHLLFLKQAVPDTHDKYWMCIRDDHYNYFGLNYDQRHELYTERPITYEATA